MLNTKNVTPKTMIQSFFNNVVFLLLVITILLSLFFIYNYYQLNIFNILSLNKYSLVSDFLKILKFKHIVFLWSIVVVLCIVWFYINLKPYAQQEYLLRYLINEESKDNLISYMLSDYTGKILWLGDLFSKVFKIKIQRSMSFVDVLSINADLKVSRVTINTIISDLKNKRTGSVTIPIAYSNKESGVRISYTIMQKFYMWQVSVIALNEDHLNYDVLSNILYNLPLPLVTMNTKKQIVYSNMHFNHIVLSSEGSLNNIILDKIITNETDEKFVPYYHNKDLVNSMVVSKAMLKDLNNKQVPVLLFKSFFYEDSRNSFDLNVNSNIKPNYTTLTVVPVFSEYNDDASNNYNMYLEYIYSNAPFGIMVVDSSDNILKTNNALRKLLNIENNNISQTLSEIFGSKGNLANKQVNTGEDKLELETDLEINGEKKWFKLVVFPLGNNEKIIYVIDLTAKRNLESQVKLSQGLQAVGQIASAVAHDFNNLLTAITGFAYFAQEKQDADDPSRVELELIKQNADRAKVMIRQLLTFSRKQDLNPVVFDVNSEISDLMSTILRLMGERVKPQFKRGKSVGKIMMDRVQFHQVITNLVINAKDAMKHVGNLEIITSSIKLTEPKELVIATIPSGDYVLIEIKDYGEGIIESNLKLIFNAYFSTKGDKGNGFGLSTVNKVVHDSAGFVDVKSTVGVGTSFYLYFPKTDREEVHEVINNEISNADLTGYETILLVEDEVPVRMVFSRLLKNKGYNVIEAEDGLDAIHLIEHNDIKNIDLVISDVMMPGLTGPEMIGRIKDYYPNIKVILMSGYTEDVLEDISTDVSLKGIEFLAKPFSPGLLATKVKSVLTGK